MERYVLHLKVKAKDLDAVEATIANGAKLNELDRSGQSPLHLAVLTANINMVEILLKAGANPNTLSIEWVTPAWRAAKLGYEEIRDLLIAYGSQAEDHKYSAKPAIRVINLVTV